jgi:multidrug efflux pump subunit AcrB
MIQAGYRRLRPITMTPLATIFGHAAAGARSGLAKMLQPLAITVIGGLVSSMVLSLIFTPATHYDGMRNSSEAL